MSTSQQSDPSQQKVISLYFKSLKNMRKFSINFEPERLTAILGPNGCGKSTVLHALACCYQPIDESQSINYKFSYFFPPTTDFNWQGSNLIMTHSYRVGRKELPTQNSEEYNEIINVAKAIHATDNSHKYIDLIIKTMDYERAVGLKVITDLIALSERWQNFGVEIKDWLSSKKPYIHES